MAARAHAWAALRAVRAAVARSTSAAAGEQTLAVGHAALGAGVQAGGCARATVPFAAARALASLPQVETVSVTVFNARGERFVLPGVVGRSVMDAVLNHPELPLASEHDNTLVRFARLGHEPSAFSDVPLAHARPPHAPSSIRRTMSGVL